MNDRDKKTIYMMIPYILGAVFAYLGYHVDPTYLNVANPFIWFCIILHGGVTLLVAASTIMYCCIPSKTYKEGNVDPVDVSDLHWRPLNYVSLLLELSLVGLLLYNGDSRGSWLLIFLVICRLCVVFLKTKTKDIVMSKFEEEPQKKGLF